MARSLTAVVCPALLLVVWRPSALSAGGNNYKNFDVALYARVYEVQKMKDPAWLESHWEAVSKHMKVDKIYLETHRDTVVIDQETLDKAKAFFLSKGVKGLRRDHGDHQRAEHVRDLLLLRTRAAEEAERGGGVHRPELRRVHPRRLLLHQLQIRQRHSRKGQSKLDRVPSGADGRSRPGTWWSARPRR
jgi:hypothetical protein